MQQKLMNKKKICSHKQGTYTNVATLEVLLQFMYLYIDTKFSYLNTPMLKAFVKYLLQ
jgi:hypothetical protein